MQYICCPIKCLMKNLVSISFLLLSVLYLASCSSTKFVGDGQYLLDKVSFSSDSAEIKSSEVKPYAMQHPNLKVFGLIRWPLYVYSLSKVDGKRWIDKQLRKIGEPPVVLDSVLVDQSVDNLQRYLLNKGYVNAKVTPRIDTIPGKKKAQVEYLIEANEPFKVRNYGTMVQDAELDSLLKIKKPKYSWIRSAFRSPDLAYTPLIKEGELFNRMVMDQERQRVTSLFRQRGYYAFNKDNVAFLADTTVAPFEADVDLVVLPFRRIMPDGSIKETEHQKYYINKVDIITDYDPLKKSNQSDGMIITDSLMHRNIHVKYGVNGRSIRPGVLSFNNYLRPGAMFDERNIDRTYSSFTRLKAIKGINIRFEEFEENDTLKLNTVILTTPSRIQTVGWDIEGTHSDGELGVASSVTYQHRNIFKGSETFSARIRGAYESLSGKRKFDVGNYWEYAVETSLKIPSMIFPFISRDFKRRLQATTELKISYGQQERPEYKRAILSGGISYSWQDRSNTSARHTFSLLDVDYVYLPYLDSTFNAELPTSTKLYNFSDQFIVSSGYSYYFNNFDPLTPQRNAHSLRVSVELAGNILYAMSNLTKAKKNKNGLYELFGLNYRQYIKGDIDYAKSIFLDERNSIAFHVGGGIGFPYGNGRELPFERRYYAGGSNNNRGWSVRSLGPGSMSLDSAYFAIQTGDIRLEASVEYRTKLFWKLEAAAFIDAGNIWTIRKYDHQPQGNFDFSRFYKEIAASYGLGLRLDFDFFVLRFDVGWKIYNPHEKGSRKWAITRPNFNRGVDGNFAWHFAVGYPF